MGRFEIVFSGFGGQGIVLAGLIIGKAAAIFDGKEAVFTQSYGPEARGGASSSSVVVDVERVDYPYAENPDLLVVMSQEAYNKRIGMLKPGGTLVYDSDLVKIDERARKASEIYGIPATRIAEEKLGKRIVANIVILGFLARICKVISKESLKKAVLDTVPRKFREVNEKAFELGYSYPDWRE